MSLDPHVPVEARVSLYDGVRGHLRGWVNRLSSVKPVEPRGILAGGLAMGLAALASLTPGFADWNASVSAPSLFGLGIPPRIALALALSIGLMRYWQSLDHGFRLLAKSRWASRLKRSPDGMPWFRYSALRLPLRDALFRCHGWLAGLAFGVAIAGMAQASLLRWLIGSRFEGAAVLLASFFGLLAGAVVGLLLDRLPRLAAVWRLDGQVDAQGSEEILEYGAAAPVLMLVVYSFGSAIGWTVAPSPLVLPLITLAALAGYALPCLLWREKPEYRRALWLVLLDPEGEGAERGARTLEQADTLAREWTDGPMTMVLDPSLDAGSDHLHAALSLGRERAMFPRIAVELADWGQLLPPRQRWLASPRRELYVPASLMLPALEQFAAKGDIIVLVSGRSGPLEAWRTRFPHGDCIVAWHGDEPAASTVAGLPAITLDSLGLVNVMLSMLQSRVQRNAEVAGNLARDAARESASASSRSIAQPVGEPMRHGDEVFSAMFSPDGKRIVTASRDATARVWDADTGKPLGAPMKHDGEVLSASFSPDGLHVLTASGDKTARVWDAATGKPMGEPMRHDAAVGSASFSPDGDRILSTSSHTAQLWVAATGSAMGRPMMHEADVSSASFSPDGQRVLTASLDTTACIWNAYTGKLLGEPMRHGDALSAAGFSPDGSRLLTASTAGSARIRDAATWKVLVLGEESAHDRQVLSAAFSADGQRVVTASLDRTARTWSADTGKPMAKPMTHLGPVAHACFNPAGSQLATASHDGTAQVWDAGTGEALSEPMRHASRVSCVGFSPDGRRVVTASADHTARVWDVSDCQAAGDTMGRQYARGKPAARASLRSSSAA